MPTRLATLRKAEVEKNSGQQVLRPQGGPSRLWEAPRTLRLPLRGPGDQSHSPLCSGRGGKARLKPSRGPFGWAFQVLLLALTIVHPPLKIRAVGPRPAHLPGTDCCVCRKVPCWILTSQPSSCPSRPLSPPSIKCGQPFVHLAVILWGLAGWSMQVSGWPKLLA